MTCGMATIRVMNLCTISAFEQHHKLASLWISVV